MEHIWAFLMQTFAGSAAALVLLLSKRLFLDKLSPRWQYGIWAILALRLLLPAGLFGRTLIPSFHVLLEAAKTGVETSLSSAFTSPYGLTEVTAPIPLITFAPPHSITDLLFYGYAAGVAVTLLWFFLAYLGLRRRVRRGRSPSQALVNQVARVSAQYGLKAPQRIVVLPEAESAFVCGPLSPVLVLPEQAVDDKVLLHELLHLKYGDLWAGLAMCVLRCLHWCNPLLWYCWNRAQNDCEALCDQRVLERLEGEDRRTYGAILLSMADDRYARAPGTTSMANGGKNIKRRISSIARFKRYPQGMALGSGCVAAVLALTCLWGTSASAAMPDPNASGALSMAQARLNRATTVAGALDTYTKALLENSPVYLAMAAPEGAQAALAQAAQEGAGLGHPNPLSLLGIQDVDADADWRVFNLLEGEDGDYTGLLVLDAFHWFYPLDNESQPVAVSQTVRVFREGGFWAVEPLTDWAAVDPACQSASRPTSVLPALTYTAQEGGIRVEIDYQYLLGVDNWIQASFSQLFPASNSSYLDSVPRPNALFTDYFRSSGGRAWDETGPISLYVNYALLTRAEAEKGNIPIADVLRQSVPVPKKYGLGGGGGSDPRGCDMQQAPAALAIRFVYQEKTYTCIAWPKEVLP